MRSTNGVRTASRAIALVGIALGSLSVVLSCGESDEPSQSGGAGGSGGSKAGAAGHAGAGAAAAGAGAGKGGASGGKAGAPGGKAGASGAGAGTSGQGAGGGGAGGGGAGGGGAGAQAGSGASGAEGGTGGGAACVPASCADKGVACGGMADGCGATVDCGPCPGPDGRYVGMYIQAPGFINNAMPTGCTKPGCGNGCGWPAHHPLAPPGGICGDSPCQYTTDNPTYWDFVLDSAAAMGVDFVIADESNGGQFHDSLLGFLDLADQRIASGKKTPRVTAMAVAADGGWMADNAARKSGAPRSSWVHLNGQPLLLIYSASPFSTDATSATFALRYACNSDNDECKQGQKDKGSVWPWATMGNSCEGFDGTCPLHAASSDEVTIQNGYSNALPCLDYWCQSGGGCPTIVGFTAAYYQAQWAWAMARLSSPAQFLLLTTYDNVEGGFLQRSVAFTPPTLYEDLTASNAAAWKGNGNLRFLGPPGAPCPSAWCQLGASSPSPGPVGCGSLLPGQRLAAGQSLLSCDGRFTLIMQPDGNLVLYFEGKPLWSKGFGSGADALAMQPDGNLVLYAGSTPLWQAPGTFGHPGAFLAVQPDGNLVAYVGTKMLWQSGTCCH